MNKIIKYYNNIICNNYYNIDKLYEKRATKERNEGEQRRKGTKERNEGRNEIEEQRRGTKGRTVRSDGEEYPRGEGEEEVNKPSF
jgi:hypothetical protein